MALWGKINQANNAPEWEVIERKAPSEAAARGSNTAFNNVTVGAWGNTFGTKGVFGANATQVAASARISHTGWHMVRQGTGPIVSFTIADGGTGYSNTDLVRVSVAAPGVNAAASLSTNATGGITTVTITSAGSGFANVASATVAITNATAGATGGSGANLVPVFGGRAGRIHYETLVAGEITGAPPATLP